MADGTIQFIACYEWESDTEHKARLTVEIDGPIIAALCLDEATDADHIFEIERALAEGIATSLRNFRAVRDAAGG